MLQQFECTVLEVAEREFSATLKDVTDRTRADEVATFDVAEVSEGDLGLLREGAIFYWSIGYAIEYGQKRREYQIRFRRLPAWTAAEVALVKERAMALERFLEELK